MCRLPYEMLVDEKIQPLGEARYLLSPGDLYTLPHLPEILSLGISALKIEGRYKDEKYVALTTQAYRKALDTAWLGLPLKITPLEKLQLEQVYSRGLGDYFIQGVNHQYVVQGRSPRHRGVLMGEVLAVTPPFLVVLPHRSQEYAPLKPGDGVVFDSADWRSPEEPEEGGSLYQVEKTPQGHLQLAFENQTIRFSRIRKGDLVWRTSDPQIHKVVWPYLHTKNLKKQALSIHVSAKEGQLLRLQCGVLPEKKFKVEVTSEEPLRSATQHPLSREFLETQLGRLGNTPYTLAQLEWESEGNPFVPSSLLNQLRRQAVELLQEQQGQLPSKKNSLSPQMILNQHLKACRISTLPDKKPAPVIPAYLHLLIRHPKQLNTALDLAPASITLDYLDLYGLKPSLLEIQKRQIVARVATPRILKPEEEGIVDFLIRLEVPLLVRSSGLLYTLRQQKVGVPLIGDFSLNAANLLASELFLRFGLERLTPTHDLNAAQITTLAQDLGASSLEVIAFQHLPIFHTEHCVFCRFLSTGTSYKDCGRPCEKHQVALKDPEGRSHPLMADVGCRNTVFSAEAQEASVHLKLWQENHLQHFRLEFVHESPSQLLSITEAWKKALQGELSPQGLQHTLKKHLPQGLTEGSLLISKDYLQIPPLD